MPTAVYVPKDYEIYDKKTGEYMSAYASGAPFRLQLCWHKYEAGSWVASSRRVTKEEAAELLQLPGSQHMVDKGYQVYYRTEQLGDKAHFTQVQLVQRPEARKKTTFGKLAVGKSYYEIDGGHKGYLLSIDNRYMKQNETEALVIDTQCVQGHYKPDDEVWIWS